ncbi:hypothetical protein ATANTOWER_018184 [Ataeniobius toweri]|uniref:Uncharacterized protein n=1 Tax=Ataeniobius toweri TaxID=208326 RepID=A0ABU7C6C3_9TELE|nr:hypothetical protein [Ataeniobius toweri]
MSLKNSQNYCSFQPHLGHVTHLEIFRHSDRLLLLSSSSDCNLALSYLLGQTVALFGQNQWSLKRLHMGQKTEGNLKEGED